MNRLLEKTPYLVPHPQSQSYWFRRRIPKNLQVPLQQTEVKVSLKTYELQEAEYLSQLEKAKVLGRVSVIEDAAQAGLYGEKINPDLSDPAVVEQYKYQLLLKEIEAVKELIAVNSGVDIKAPEHQTPLVDETDHY